jgi:putative restriction endonuclease
MRYWWVNQNQTFKSEVRGGFLWSPKTRKDGARNQFYENMRQVAEGDIVFSFCNTWIMAVGVALGAAESSPKPDFGAAGATWANEGWLVPVEFKELVKQIRPKDHIALLQPYLPAKYSPLQSNGDGLQSVYLAEVPTPMAEALIALIGQEYWSAAVKRQGESYDDAFIEDQQEDAIKGRIDIGATTKDQLVRSRRGQGIFKANVRLNEKACRITGVTDLQHLRASHIKPWKDSTDEEKLNGCNGLLLSPHADHLFDKGLISFADNGSLLISPQLDEEVLAKWTIPKAMNVGPFKPQQSAFLAYHRETVFKKG